MSFANIPDDTKARLEMLLEREPEKQVMLHGSDRKQTRVADANEDSNG